MLTGRPRRTHRTKLSSPDDCVLGEGRPRECGNFAGDMQRRNSLRSFLSREKAQRGLSVVGERPERSPARPHRESRNFNFQVPITCVSENASEQVMRGWIFGDSQPEPSFVAFRGLRHSNAMPSLHRASRLLATPLLLCFLFPASAFLASGERLSRGTHPSTERPRLMVPRAAGSPTERMCSSLVLGSEWNPTEVSLHRANIRDVFTTLPSSPARAPLAFLPAVAVHARGRPRGNQAAARRAVQAAGAAGWH